MAYKYRRSANNTSRPVGAILLLAIALVAGFKIYQKITEMNEVRKAEEESLKGPVYIITTDTITGKKDTQLLAPSDLNGKKK